MLFTSRNIFIDIIFGNIFLDIYLDETFEEYAKEKHIL